MLSAVYYATQPGGESFFIDTILGRARISLKTFRPWVCIPQIGQKSFLVIRKDRNQVFPFIFNILFYLDKK